MTKKLIKQIREAEDDAVVEGTSQSVSCFLWSPSQQKMNEEVTYKMRDFRQSDIL
jgi:hypothetical protein